MILETFDSPWDFELLDTGDGYRLEQWGDTAPRTLNRSVQGAAGSQPTGTGVVLARPDPQIIWPKSSQQLWEKIDAKFIAGKKDEKGTWDIRGKIPNAWKIGWHDINFLLKLSPFKHTGLFPEQAAQWSWMTSKLSSSSSYKVKSPKILNLFAYTGGATMVLAKEGCQVTHLDASKTAITWANENHKLNNLPKDSVRWMLDDAAKFVKRELKRGAKYEGIVMDPPAFGHAPSGKVWKFNDDLPGLLETCIKLLSDEARFLIINGYATNSSAIAINNLLEDAMRDRGGKIEFGELCLQQKSGRLISTGIFARWHAT